MFPPYLVPRLVALASFPRRRMMASLPNHSTLSKAPVSISYPSLLAAPSTLLHSIGVSVLYCTPCQSSLFISHHPTHRAGFRLGPGLSWNHRRSRPSSEIPRAEGKTIETCARVCPARWIYPRKLRRCEKQIQVRIRARAHH